MTDEQIIDIIISNLRQKSPQNLITDILAPRQLWDETESNRIRNILALLTNSNKISIVGGDKYFPKTDIKLKLEIGTDKRKEILLHLFNSGSVSTDLRQLIKSLAMTRKEIIDTFTILAIDGIVQSDNLWRQFKIVTAGVEKSIDKIPFNFRLTPKGEQLVLSRYMQQPIIQKEFISNVIGEYVQGNVINTGNNSTIQYQQGNNNSSQIIMKQSEKLDLILKELYKHKNDGSYYSISSICQSLNIQLDSYLELNKVAHRLKDDGFINAIFTHNDCRAELTSFGIEYCEENSYTYSGRSIITNNYSVSIVNSPNSNIVNQSQNVTINQNIEDVKDAIEKIREVIANDLSFDKEKANEILECLSEIQVSINNHQKPKFAIKSLLDLAGSIASISSWVTTLGQFAGIIPLL